MDKIIGKTLLFTDIHFGLKNNSIQKLNICISVIKDIIKNIKKNNIQNCIFAGDLFHNRVNLSVDTINIVIKCIKALSKVCNVYLIIGNHDIFNKSNITINSINIFLDTPNVFIIDKPTEVDFNGKRMLLCSWLSELDGLQKETYDVLIGHFDISVKYLLASYISDNKIKAETSERILNSFITNDNFLKTDCDLKDSQQLTANDVEKIKKMKNKANDLIGSFVELTKKGGLIFSGHIHTHKEFISKFRHFIFIGSPYEQTIADIGNDKGIYILNEDLTYTFLKIENVPKHIILRMSNIVDNIETYDFSIVTGNIIKKIYDVNVDRVIDSKITHKIIDYKPYEELIPEFEVDINNEEHDIITESVECIQKSKLEYIRNYISNIDKKILEEQSLDTTKLFSILQEYYEKLINQ